MTRDQALREARKRWGKKAHMRAGDELSSPEKREVADAIWLQAKTRVEQIDAEIKERLAALDWYQALMAERREARDRKEKNQWVRGYYKFTVGALEGIGFHVYGTGDTWEESFGKADERMKASKAS